MTLFGSNSERVLSGVLLIVIATVFLISGLGWFRYPIFSYNADTLIAFIALIFGVALITQETKK